MPPPPQLPPELVGLILRLLDVEDLRLAAAVCRDFYRQAWRAGLFIQREFHMDGGQADSTRFTALSEVTEHVVTKNLRLALTLRLCDWAAPHFAQRPSIRSLLRLTSIALPVLVKLCLHDRHRLCDRIAVALSHPAPHLQSLNLRLYPSAAPVSPDPVLPAEIFDGDSPKLRDVTLLGIHLPIGPVAAFARVVSLALTVVALRPDIVLAQHFPALRSLFLSAGSGNQEVTAAAILYGLRGVQLEWLLLEEHISGDIMSLLMREDNVAKIPSVENDSERDNSPESARYWTKDGPFGMFITDLSLSPTSRPCPRQFRITLVPVHQRWYRGYQFRPGRHVPVFISDLPGVANGLTYLRVDSTPHLHILLSTGVVFEALVEMRVDFQQSSIAWPPHLMHLFAADFDMGYSSDQSCVSARTFLSESYSYVHCPSLKTLRLCSRHQLPDLVSRQVAYLGRTLSQCKRPKQDRAALQLHGLRLMPPTGCELLKEVYSVVRHSEFTRCDGPIEADSGLWNIAYRCPFQ